MNIVGLMANGIVQWHRLDLLYKFQDYSMIAIDDIYKFPVLIFGLCYVCSYLFPMLISRLHVYYMFVYIY